jgi:CheY-like chemotaxis protein/two-component sensor histidine kinase
MANVSHELRTPLNAIIGYTELLIEDIEEFEAQSDLRKIHDASMMLLGLIDDVLDLAKIEAGKAILGRDEFDLAALVQEVVDMLEPSLSHGVTLTCELADDLGVMHSDRLRMKQILTNLLSNAIKFTPDGSITVRAYNDINGEDIVIDITDTGVGVSSERLDQLFLPFERGEQERSTVKGTGLGLALSRYLSRLMGGDIAAVSEQGKGSTFTFRAPRTMRVEDGKVVETAANIPAAQALTPQDEQFKVLVIDDDFAMGDLLARLSEPMGIHVLWVPSGQRALEIAPNYKPDLILLDRYLKQESGWDVLSDIRSCDVLGETPVGMMTVSNELSRSDIDPRITHKLKKPISRTMWEQVLSKHGVEV